MAAMCVASLMTFATLFPLKQKKNHKDLEEVSSHQEIPPTIFGVPSQQHKSGRIREFFSSNEISTRIWASKETLLRELAEVEDSYRAVNPAALKKFFLDKTIPNNPVVTGIVLKCKEHYVKDLLTLSRTPNQYGAEWECKVCLTNLPRVEFSETRITDDCKHMSHVCLPCLQQSLEFQIHEKAWDQITCPECPAKLHFENVKEFVSPTAFEKYEKKSLLAALERLPGFCMCLGTTCDLGQIHTGGSKNPIMKCRSCGFVTCYNHHLPWHLGKSCEQFDQDMRGTDHVKHEAASAKYLGKLTNVCPNPNGCGWRLEQETGCDKMTCSRCRYMFCWQCLAPYENIRKVGNKAHQKWCKWHTNKLNGIPGHGQRRRRRR